MAHKRINRREFIGKTAMGLASTGMALPLWKSTSAGQDHQDKIIYRILGRTKLRIPVISFGVMNSDSQALIRRAIEKGVNHLDTAWGYLRGNSELAIGKTLEEDKSRDKVYIATKMRFARDSDKNIFVSKGSAREPAATAENLLSQLGVSLKRLRTDYIDILYIHSCYSPEMATYEPLMKGLLKAKESGKARFIGVSTHRNEPDVIRAAVDVGIYDVILTAFNIVQKHKDDVKKAIQYAASKDVGIIAMKAHGGVRLNQDSNAEINHEAALKWVLNDQNVCTTIPGMTTFEQLDFNIRVMNNLALTAAEQRELQLTSMLKGTLYCQNCRSCIPTCSNRVEIPNLMRAYMYTEGYGNLIQAQMTVEELPKKRGINICQECSSCTASCQHGINIDSRVKSLLAKGLVKC